MDKESEPCTNSPPNLTSTPKNEEIFLGRELAEEGRAEVRKCGSAGGVPLSLVHTASSKQFSLQERAKIDTEQKPSRSRSLGLGRGGWL